MDEKEKLALKRLEEDKAKLLGEIQNLLDKMGFFSGHLFLA